MHDLRSTLQKLEPFYPRSKLDALFIKWQTSDKIGQRDLEEKILKIAAKHGIHSTEDRIILPPPPQSEGDIPIGTVSYLENAFFDYKLKLSELTRHAGIFGSTGTGKTTLARNMIQSLIDNKIPFMLFDWETSYRQLVRDNPDVIIFTIGKPVSPFKFNFFKIPPGIHVEDYVKNIIQVFSKAYIGGAGSDTILLRTFDRGYSYTREPKLEDVGRVLETMMKSKTGMRGREMLWKQSAMRMIEFLLYGSTAEIFNTGHSDLESLFNKQIIFELGGISSEADRRFFIEMLILWYTLYKTSKGIEDEKLKHVLIFEEFHNIVSSTKKDDLIYSLFRQLRKYGTGMIAIDQTPSLIPNAIFENMGTKITFSLEHKDNVSAISKAMFMDREETDYIGLLKIGEAIVRCKERSPHPFMVKVPFEKKELNITDKDLHKLIKPYFKYSAITENSNDKQPSYSTSPRNEYVPVGAPLILLQNIATHPFMGTNDRYKKLGLSPREGTEFKQKLQDGRYIRPVNVDRKMLYELTDNAREFLAVRKFKIPSQARGGVEHNYWLEKVRSHLIGKGKFAQREMDEIDVVAEKPNSATIYVQIETGKSNIKKNIETLLKQDGDLYMLATSAKAKAKIETFITQSRLPHSETIQLFTAKEFLAQTG